MMRSKDGRVTSQVVKVVHDDSDEKIQHLQPSSRQNILQHEHIYTLHAVNVNLHMTEQTGFNEGWKT